METLNITQTEIDERVEILKRLRHLLEEQRAKFQDYLLILEKQEVSIRTDNVNAISEQAELEEQIVANINNLQRVIKPMEDLYRSVYPHGETEIPQMKTDLYKLQTQVLAQNERNRNLLKNNIVHIRNQIAKFKNPYANRKSIYAAEMRTANYIDVQQ
ncbi:MAG: flagellar biosynthesis protein FlgN [Treponemataceae bacterium]|nr:flagellar biosynthesis protein FlgN [Treponemataceae bacterium]